MPALAGRDEIESVIAKSGRFSRALDVAHRNPGLRVEQFGLLHQRGGFIEAGDFKPADGEASRDGPGAGAEVERLHSVARGTHRHEPIEKRIGEARAMLCVVARGLAEIDLVPELAHRFELPAEAFSSGFGSHDLTV